MERNHAGASLQRFSTILVLGYRTRWQPSLQVDFFFRLKIVVKNLPVNTGDLRNVGSIPGLGRSPARGHGNPL